jgi:integrase
MRRVVNLKLTKKLIDTFVFEDSGKKDIRWDSEMPGFGLRIYPSGKKSFVLSYRQSGTKRLFTIGQYGNITLEQAKDLARKKMGEVADGQDPLLKRQASKKKHEWTVNKAYKDFLQKYAKTHTKNWGETDRIFEKDILPAIGKKPIDEVKKDDILKILDKVTDRKSGIMANRTLAALRKFFNWCVQRNLIEHSPAYMVAAPTRARSRDRVLSDFELKDIWTACDNFAYPFGPMIQFLILTGQRRGEVATMRWEDYDKEHGLWVLPRESTKSDRLHEVPLSDMAVKILASVPIMGDYVFTSSGKRPFENFSRDKKTLDAMIDKKYKELERLSIGQWRVHDLRRTAASGMARLDVPPHIVEKILNHTAGIISGVAAVYNRYEYTSQKRLALNQWSNYVQNILDSEIENKSYIGTKSLRKK